MLQEKRVASDEILNHPWLHIPLAPEQQAAWDALQQEQAELDKQLKEQGNPRVVSLGGHLVAGSCLFCFVHNKINLLSQFVFTLSLLVSTPRHQHSALLKQAVSRIRRRFAACFASLRFAERRRAGR